MRPAMIGHGIAAATLAAATAVAGDHSIAVAVITAASGLTVIIAAQIGQGVREYLREQRAQRKRRPIDHLTEHRDELLDIAEHFRLELIDAHEQIADLEREVRRLKRGRRG